MTQKNGHEPENRNWMDIAEGDAINEVRHSRGRLPFVAAAIALVAVGGGALFAQTNNPAPSQVEPSSVVTAVATALPTTGQQVTQAPPVASTGIPTIAPVAGGGYNGDDDDEDDEEDDDREDEDDEEDEEDDD